MSIEQKRVEPGVPTAGQWTAATKPEGGPLPVPPTVVFDTAFEDMHGAGLAAELAAMEKPTAADLIAASNFVDPLRESYEEYYAEPGNSRSVRDAQDEFMAQLPSLDGHRAEQLLALVGFAVHNEMKNLTSAPVTSPEYDWEVLIEPSDYRNEDDLEDRGAEDNRAKWEEAANTAAFHVLREEARAAEAERKYLAA